MKLRFKEKEELESVMPKILRETKPCLKFISEAGELADNIAVGNHDAAQDDLGDVLVTLILLAELIDTDLMTCLTDSYNVIRKRSGKMVNGIFVKDVV